MITLRIVNARAYRPATLPKSSPDKPFNPDALMLHQTAVDYGNASDEALIKRFERVPYHFALFRRGLFLLNRPLDLYSWHGGKGNRFSWGFAMEGLYPGLIGGKVWGSKPETPWTPELGSLLRCALEVVREECPEIKRTVTHRQSSDKRRSDPGEAICLSAAPKLEALGMPFDYDWTVGTGKPMALAWGGSARY